MTYDKSHTWFEIDFGDVEELCQALDQATVFAYKERMEGIHMPSGCCVLPDIDAPVFEFRNRLASNHTPLEFRVRVDIEGTTMWISSRNETGKYERELDLAYSPFGNSKFDYLPDSIRPPRTVAFMVDPTMFAHYLRELGSKCEIMLPDLNLRWDTVNVKAAMANSRVESKRRPV